MFKKNILDFIIPIFLLLSLTIIFNLTGLDLIIQSKFYNSETGWFLKNSQPWSFIYNFGNLPALILSVGALLIIALSTYYEKLKKITKVSLYLILVMALGPGLLVNSILKDNWGRPRPRNIAEFGGKYQYEEVLTIDPESRGKSFPCGHASMGFYFFVLYFIFRKKNKCLAGSLLFFSLIFGSLIGLARIIQGGHFASDVIWTGGLLYLTSALVYYFMKLDKFSRFENQITIGPGLRRILLFFSIFLIFLAITFVTLATPYSGKKNFELPPEIDSLNIKYLQAELHFLKSDLLIQSSDTFNLEFKAEGFGFPGSRVSNEFEPAESGGTLLLNFTQKITGFFSELEQNNSINIPSALTGDLFLSLEKGELEILVPENSSWLIIPGNVETITDSSNYLSQMNSWQDPDLTINVELPLGNLKITR
ncbi:MAG: hypothetical protein APR54_05625 [Candidatus Cloacimonas sp. SDB]|nr:MAG: hypothetical protein APR54_05625 [Candidatus Cloacimonas sp. SDB]